MYQVFKIISGDTPATIALAPARQSARFIKLVPLLCICFTGLFNEINNTKADMTLAILNRITYLSIFSYLHLKEISEKISLVINSPKCIQNVKTRRICSISRIV